MTEQKTNNGRGGTKTLEKQARKKRGDPHDVLWAVLPESEDLIEPLESWNDSLFKKHARMSKSAERQRDMHPDDLLSVYLAEMSQEPLLTFEQEVDLARQIERGHQAYET